MYPYLILCVLPQDKYGYEQDLMTYLMDLVVTCDRRVSLGHPYHTHHTAEPP